MHVDYAEMRRKVIDTWEVMQHLDLMVEKALEEIEWKEGIMATWHVPQSTIKNHQVIDRKPMFSHIRNNI